MRYNESHQNSTKNCRGGDAIAMANQTEVQWLPTILIKSVRSPQPFSDQRRFHFDYLSAKW